MILNRLLILFAGMGLVLGINGCSTPDSHSKAPNYTVIPKPASLIPGNGAFEITQNTEIHYNDEAVGEAVKLFADQLSLATGWEIVPKQAEGTNGGNIVCRLDPSVEEPEGYTLEVSPEGVKIMAGQTVGVFYALQTLRQLLPVEFERGEAVSGMKWTIASVKIKDAPRFAYRGLHLDVARHMFPVDFIKRFLDLMALHKMNRFHWHLTEDQGWRIEIKKYPKLAEVAAYRDETLIGHYREQPQKFDGKRYGGYYTQEEVKELVAYAAERHIEVIPEIEMPGHSLAALSAYPELACTPGPFKAATKWGVFEDIFCPTEETFTFLENVLTEVIDLFPSEYIHIGGDEAPKARWEESKFCQDLIRREGLKDEHGLQSYFIQRMEKFVNSKGRKIIGWDEILEGGLAPNATVMSWRGTEGGIEAAKEGHDVIMTPTSHCYFDYYQGDSRTEPLAIGGYLPLEKVYNYEPVPKELSAEEAKYILGAQGNLWTEYIPTGEKVEYMMFPRAIAMAELTWTAAEQKDYQDFAMRLDHHFGRLDELKVNYAKTLYDVKIEVLPDSSEQKIKVSMESFNPELEIRYTLDGSEAGSSSSLYSGLVNIDQNAEIRAAAYRNGEKVSSIAKLGVKAHMASAIVPSLKSEPSEKYNAGPFVLTDGVRGTDLFNDLWYGFDGEDMEAVIDLGELQNISRISAGFLHTTYAWIFYPSSVEFAISEDENSFETVFREEEKSGDLEETGVGIYEPEAVLENTQARYIKVTVNNRVIPEWHGGSGKKGWLFIDEIIVE